MKEEKIKSIEYSSKFLKSLARLPKRIVKIVEEKEKIFKENPFNPRLKTHKLRGKEKESWAFWINFPCPFWDTSRQKNFTGEIITI